LYVSFYMYIYIRIISLNGTIQTGYEEAERWQSQDGQVEKRVVRGSGKDTRCPLRPDRG